MYVPHPGVETEQKATQMLTEEFLDICEDEKHIHPHRRGISSTTRSRKRTHPGLTKNTSWADQISG
jgi:hypothetical protein